MAQTTTTAKAQPIGSAVCAGVAFTQVLEPSSIPIAFIAELPLLAFFTTSLTSHSEGFGNYTICISLYSCMSIVRVSVGRRVSITNLLTSCIGQISMPKMYPSQLLERTRETQNCLWLCRGDRVMSGVPIALRIALQVDIHQSPPLVSARPPAHSLGWDLSNRPTTPRTHQGALTERG